MRFLKFIFLRNNYGVGATSVFFLNNGSAADLLKSNNKENLSVLSNGFFTVEVGTKYEKSNPKIEYFTPTPKVKN
jgi:hypothetical protein